MAVKLNELEATGTRWNAPSEDYPQGSFINGTGQGKRDGSYAKAEWANDLFGAHAAILKNGGETPNGKVETANNSQVFNALKKIIKTDIDTLGGDPSAVASGTVNAITATFTKPVSLEGGKQVKVRALGANTSATVTFNPNNLGAKPIVKGDGSALSVGDIASAGFWMTLIYDATLQKWILQNPATGVTLVLPEASTSTKGIIQIASSAEIGNGTDVPKAITPKQFKEAMKDLGGGLPLGHLFAWPFQTPPDGCIQCNGSTYSRVLYKDFWNYISSKGWVKTEDEWNGIASANGGYCPYYSTGDGSTTFRTPKFAPFMQAAIASANVGTYHRAGLPNIKGDLPAGENGDVVDIQMSGAFYQDGTNTNRGLTSDTDNRQAHFDASRSNPIYGRSSTAQPELSEWMICVVVMGMATNIGNADVADVMQAVAQVQSQVNTTVKTINNQKPNSSGNISISTAIGFPSYTSYVTIALGDYTPSDNGWIRMDLATGGDYEAVSCTHKASGQQILYYSQARYPGNGCFMCPVCKNETYTLAGKQGKIWFHKCRG